MISAPRRPRYARTFLPTVAAAAALLLAACGGGEEAPAAASPEPGPLTVTHARGETEVPADPQRIVVLEPVQLDTAVALGEIPVGAAVLSEATGIPRYLGTQAEGITMVGTVPEPSIERVAALQPDLILGTESRHAELYDQLSAVAPTVFIADHADPWQDNVLLVGRALGAEDRARELLDRYQDRCAEVGEAHGLAGRTAQLVRPRNDVLALYGPTSFAGSTLECAGFTIPERDWQGSISVDLSPELAAEAQADHVFVTTADPANPATMPPALTVNAALLPELHLVDQAFWITGVGPLGGMAVLDDIDRIVAGSSSG